MYPHSLSLEDRFRPLIQNGNENENGNAISFQNILDLQTEGVLDNLKRIRSEIATIHSPGPQAAQNELLLAFNRFVSAMEEMAQAKEIKTYG